jgi:hypothetical protein
MCKTCSKCGETKSLDQFGKNKRKRDGLQVYCKPCQCELVKKSQSKESFARPGASTNRKYILKSRYGLTPEQYAGLMVKQEGRCAICHGECPTGWRLAVDHCHASGKVRGLLCGNCNTALGKFKDSPELLANAIKYLQENQ